MPTTRRFAIRFTGANRAMGVLGLLPRWCWVEVDPDLVRVQMAWSFRAAIPRASVQSVVPYQGRVFGWGVHGWRGAWLVNGSSSGLVRIEIDPPARAWLLAVVPLRLRTLTVSVDDPDALIAALAP